MIELAGNRVKFIILHRRKSGGQKRNPVEQRSGKILEIKEDSAIIKSDGGIYNRPVTEITILKERR